MALLLFVAVGPFLLIWVCLFRVFIALVMNLFLGYIVVFLGHGNYFLGYIVSVFRTVRVLGRVLRLGHDVSLLGHENHRLGHIVSVF